MKNLSAFSSTIVLLLLRATSTSRLDAFAFAPRRASTTRRSRLPATAVWIEEADDGFVDEDENLMTGEVCLRAVKAFARFDDDDEPLFLGAAALVSRPPPCSHVRDCWTADSEAEETNLQLKGATMMLDDLVLWHSTRPARGCDDDDADALLLLRDLVVRCGPADGALSCASHAAARRRGFVPDPEVDGMVFDAAIGVERYAAAASANETATARLVADALSRSAERPTSRCARSRRAVSSS